MSKDKLTKAQQSELEDMMNEITTEAKNVVNDYNKNPSEISGSVVAIHQDSPFLDERIAEGSNWKRVLKNMTGDEAAEIVEKYAEKKDAD